MSCGNSIYIPLPGNSSEPTLYSSPPMQPDQGLPIPSPSLALKDIELDEEVEHPTG